MKNRKNRIFPLCCCLALILTHEIQPLPSIMTLVNLVVKLFIYMPRTESHYFTIKDHNGLDCSLEVDPSIKTLKDLKKLIREKCDIPEKETLTLTYTEKDTLYDMGDRLALDYLITRKKTALDLFIEPRFSLNSPPADYHDSHTALEKCNPKDLKPYDDLIICNSEGFQVYAQVALCQKLAQEEEVVVRLSARQNMRDDLVAIKFKNIIGKIDNALHLCLLSKTTF